MKALPEINPLFDGVEVDERILKYYYNNHVRQFVYDRPTHIGSADKDNEFKVGKHVIFMFCHLNHDHVYISVLK